MKTPTAEPRTTACVIDAERSSNKSFFENADKPTLHGLSYALRHPETWPEGFTWNYGQCGQCAMGLAHALWKEIPRATTSTASSLMARAFAISYESASSIFLGKIGNTPAKWIPSSIYKTEVRGHLWWKTSSRKAAHWDAITPEMVADQIDKYIATAE